MTTLRPSITTDGIHAKSDSRSTTWEACTAASLPDAIATLQSASFKARMSFTPSPVMATVLPCFFKACTNSLFWAGVTLPNTVYLPTAHPISSFVLSVAASTYNSAFLIPASFAISDTVNGLSPEITFTSTPCSVKYEKVSDAFFLIGLVKRIYASGRTFPFSFPSSGLSSDSPNTKTR